MEIAVKHDRHHMLQGQRLILEDAIDAVDGINAALPRFDEVGRAEDIVGPQMDAVEEVLAERAHPIRENLCFQGLVLCFVVKIPLRPIIIAMPDRQLLVFLVFDVKFERGFASSAIIIRLLFRQRRA